MCLRSLNMAFCYVGPLSSLEDLDLIPLVQNQLPYCVLACYVVASVISVLWDLQNWCPWGSL